MPFCVAVCGGIASGKSAVCVQFSELGITVIDADVVSRELVAPGTPAMQEIAAQIGKQFIQANGELNRAQLRAHIFNHPEAKRLLEGILHPRIQAQLQLKSQMTDSAYVVVAIPLLNPQTRIQAYSWINRVLLVAATEQLQIQRIMQRDNCSMELAEAMLNSQLTHAERLPMANDVFINDTDISHLHRWTMQLHQRYLSLAEPVEAA